MDMTPEEIKANYLRYKSMKEVLFSYEDLTLEEYTKRASPHGILPKVEHRLGWPYTDPNIPYDC